jgi:hypothetical protein
MKDKYNTNILYNNIIGPINPKDNLITKLNYSDHYLLYKKILLENNILLHLFNINIAQQNIKSSILKYNRLNIPLRSRENIEILFNYKLKIINFILENSKSEKEKIKDYIDILDPRTKLYKNINNKFIKKYGNIFKIFKIIIKKIDKINATTFIKENLELNNDNNYYYFDLIFEEERLKDYKNRIKNCFNYIIDTIKLIDKNNFNNYYVINTQEFNPYYLVINEIDNFMIRLEKKIGIKFKVIINNNLLLSETTSISFVSVNTKYEIKSVNNDLLIKLMKKQKKIASPTKYFKFSYKKLPTIYNFHTNLYNYSEIIELLKILKNMNNFIICGDLNFRLINDDTVKLIKIFNNFNINIELTATPESNYKNNYFTYDVIIYKL